jgi:hypothetical protein
MPISQSAPRTPCAQPSPNLREQRLYPQVPPWPGLLWHSVPNDLRSHVVNTITRSRAPTARAMISHSSRAIDTNQQNISYLTDATELNNRHLVVAAGGPPLRIRAT